MPFAAAAVGAIVVGAGMSASAAKKAAKSQKEAAGRVSDSSDYAAGLSYKLGNDELDFAKRQYDDDKLTTDRVVNQQMDISQQTADQGQDYYDYLKTYRPVEQSMMYESMGLTPDMIDAMRAEQGTASQSILAGLIDETPYQADLEAARTLLGATPTKTAAKKAPGSGAGAATETPVTPMRTTPWTFEELDAANSQPAGEGQSVPLAGIVGIDADTSPADAMAALESNPEYAAALAQMTDAQKKALIIGAQNDALRKKARAAEDDVFNKYSGQASRSTAAGYAKTQALDDADAKVIGGSDSHVYGLRRGEIDAGVGRAVADTQGGFTRSLNQTMRQGLRYGNSNAGMNWETGDMGMRQASAIASAANSARAYGINNERGLASTNLGLRRDSADFMNKQKAIDWAKKLDAAGLVKGMPGASAGAYGLAVSAGNSAVKNTMAPGAQYMQGMQTGSNTIMSGANARTNANLAMLNMPNYEAQAGMALGGALVGAGTSYFGKK